MSLLQKPPATPEEIEQSKPLDIPPETVLTFYEGSSREKHPRRGREGSEYGLQK